MMVGTRMINAGVNKGPRDLLADQVWPKERSYLLDVKYDYSVVAVMVKSGMTCSDALLHFHYPSLYDNPMVLFCDTGDHIVVYLAELVDKES